MRQRLPLVLSILALTIAVLGATPALEAATAVKQALFANNAGAVNGIKASKVAKPNQLVPLDASGHFPAAVLAQGPPGPIGPPGPQGQRGVAGVDGAASVMIRSIGVVPLGVGGSGIAGGADVIVVPNVPAGTYFAIFTGDIYNVQDPYDFFRCRIVGPAGSFAEGVTSAGGAGSAEGASAMTVMGGVVLSAPGTVTVRCWHDTIIGAAQIEQSRLALLRIAALDAS